MSTVTALLSPAYVLVEDDTAHVVTVGLQGDPGTGGGDAVTLVFNETPTGTVNGSNAVFTLAHTPVAGVLVSLNGLVQAPGAGRDYTVSGQTLTFSTPPETGDIILTTYVRQ